MKAVTWHGKRDVRVDTVPDPTIQEPNDVIVRITSTGDLRLGPAPLRGARPVPDGGRHPRPRADGHRRGGRRRGHRAPAGDRVVVPFNISCGSCFMCEQGLHSQCETTQVREHGKGAALFGYTKLYGQVPGGPGRVPARPVRRLRCRSRCRRGRPTIASSSSPTCCPRRGRPSSTRPSPTAAPSSCSASGRSATWRRGSRGTAATSGDRRRPRARAPRARPRRRRRGRSTCASTTTISPTPSARRPTGAGPDAVIDAVGMEAHGSPAAKARADDDRRCCPTRSPRRSCRRAGIDRLRRAAPRHRPRAARRHDLAQRRLRRDDRPAADAARCSTSRSSCAWARRTSSAGSTTSCRCCSTTRPARRRRLRHPPSAARRGARGYEMFQKKEDGFVKVLLRP